MSRVLPSNLMRYFRIWMALWPCIAAILSILMFGVPKAVLLSWKHATTPGVVSGVDYSNHGVPTVQFAVAAKGYTQEFLPIGAGAGTPVLVRYFPGHPALSMLDEPRRALVDGVIFSSIGASFFSTFLTGIVTIHSYFHAYRKKWPILSKPSQ